MTSLAVFRTMETTLDVAFWLRKQVSKYHLPSSESITKELWLTLVKLSMKQFSRLMCAITNRPEKDGSADEREKIIAEVTGCLPTAVLQVIVVNSKKTKLTQAQYIFNILSYLLGRASLKQDI